MLIVKVPPLANEKPKKSPLFTTLPKYLNKSKCAKGK